jgi:hypothetical protein
MQPVRSASNPFRLAGWLWAVKSSPKDVEEEACVPALLPRSALRKVRRSAMHFHADEWPRKTADEGKPEDESTPFAFPYGLQLVWSLLSGWLHLLGQWLQNHVDMGHHHVAAAEESTQGDDSRLHAQIPRHGVLLHNIDRVQLMHAYGFCPGWLSVSTLLQISTRTPGNWGNHSSVSVAQRMRLSSS